MPSTVASSSPSLGRLGELAEAASQLALKPTVSGAVAGAAGADRSVRGLSRHARLGDQLTIAHADGEALAEVVRIDEDRVVATLYDERSSAYLRAQATRLGPATVRPSVAWLGRSVDALGRPVDGGGPLRQGAEVPLYSPPIPALERSVASKPLRTGVRAVDLFAPLMEGQRIGIFSGSGVGKTTLLGMIAGASQFDAVVMAFVGERGREVTEALEGPLAPHRERTVCVVSTSDQTAMMRRAAPQTAMAIAEHLRNQGLSVLLLMDSLTRAAGAAREVALASGEAPVARGFPPSVFQGLARLVERAGPGRIGADRMPVGAVTAVFTVLVEGDDLDEPVADAVRGILDGHIVLSRKAAEAGRFPAVDPLASLSRMAPRAFTKEQGELSRSLRAMIARYEDSADLRLFGGYRRGTDPHLDRAVDVVPLIYGAISQPGGERSSGDVFAELADILAGRSAPGQVAKRAPAPAEADGSAQPSKNQAAGETTAAPSA
ncbi:MAG: FliI/YscN family ATPase [Pseudomonadota bacterium]